MTVGGSASPDESVFKALADGRRRAILDLLREGSKTTGQLCAAFPVLDRCTVMQHIAVLENAGLLVSQRQGRTRLNHLDVAPLVRIQKRWLGSFLGSALQGLANLDEALNDPA